MASNDYGDYGSIHRTAFKGGASTVFALAILASIGRFAIRWTQQRRFFADDYVLLFGVITLIASFTLIMVAFNLIYFSMFLILGPPDKVIQQVVQPDFVDKITRYQKLLYSAEVLNWGAIFSVKLSYLLFFRQMVDRLKGIKTYWKVCMGIVVVSGAFCVCGIFITCPHFGAESVKCAQGSGHLKTSAISWLGNALDMFTDLLIVTIPIIVLYKVKIRLQQKFILGAFLCLSMWMFAITLIRACNGDIKGNIGEAIDLQWFIFWHFTEAAVAVMVVSLTAFRSLYNRSTQDGSQKRRFPWFHTYRKKLLNYVSPRRSRKYDEYKEDTGSSQQSPSSIEHQTLPHIPSATMTGIRSMIDRKSWMPVEEKQSIDVGAEKVEGQSWLT